MIEGGFSLANISISISFDNRSTTDGSISVFVRVGLLYLGWIATYDSTMVKIFQQR